MRKGKYRITADLDNISLNIARIRTYLIVRWLYDKMHIHINKLKLRRSSSGKGVHIILFTDDKITNRKIFLIRSLIGDDARRIAHDKHRRRPKQYLFKEKIRIKMKNKPKGGD